MPSVPSSTKVRSTAAVSHLADEATAIGTERPPDPTATSSTSVPSRTTTMAPPPNPARATRFRNAAVVRSKAPGPSTGAVVVVDVGAEAVAGAFVPRDPVPIDVVALDPSAMAR
jgi:hypothetical protein